VHRISCRERELFMSGRIFVNQSSGDAEESIPESCGAMGERPLDLPSQTWRSFSKIGSVITAQANGDIDHRRCQPWLPPSDVKVP
jgi:hypothetical protein